MDPRLATPFTMLVSGNSGCGKSTLVAKIVESSREVFDEVPEKIVICYTQMQDLYDSIQRKAPCPVDMIEGLPEDLVTSPRTLLIIDDLQGQQTKTVADWFTKKSHHMNTSVIYLVQNIFAKTPEHRTISLNAHYLVIFKNPRDASQIMFLSKQVFPSKHQLMVSAYRQATEAPHTYLFVDFKQNTPDIYRLRSSIFLPCSVYVDEKMSRDQSLLRRI